MEFDIDEGYLFNNHTIDCNQHFTLNGVIL